MNARMGKRNKDQKKPSAKLTELFLAVVNRKMNAITAHTIAMMVMKRNENFKKP